MKEEVKSYLETKIDDAVKLLCDLIRIPSTRGNDGTVNSYFLDSVKPFVDECELVPFPESIKQDPDYAFALEGLNYEGRPNLRGLVRGSGEGKSLILNTHLDVVPPSKMQNKPFDPQIQNGIVYGRGACDAKGQAAMLYLTLRALKELNINLRGDVIFHTVIEEECGGNGTLALVREGCQADAAIVLEPADLCIIPAVRGAVWFEVTCYGRAGHSGSGLGVVSAIKKAHHAMEILERYHDRLLAASRGHILFDQFENPMPITFGMIQAGEWPAATPDEAVFKGVLGFLPPKSRFEVQHEMKQAILDEGDDWLRNNFELKFPMLNSDGNLLPTDHPLVKLMQEACRQSHLEPKLSALTGSCDAWFYNNIAEIPTVVFGIGRLQDAHSAQDQVSIQHIRKGAEILVNFISLWCNS